MHYPTRIEIEELSPDDRLRLIGDVWDTLEPNSVPLSDGHREILESGWLSSNAIPSKP